MAMKRRGWWLGLVLVAGCVADDATDIDAREDDEVGAALVDDETEGAHEEAAPELASREDPTLAPNCTYVIDCQRPAQDLVPVLVCDLPPFEPWNPWDPDPDLPPLEPVTPLEPATPLSGAPDLDRLTTAGGSVADIPWPPHGCYEDFVLVDVVHHVECRNRCDQPPVEDCQDLTTNEVWSHLRTRRPAEFSHCVTTGWEPCNPVNTCEQ